MSQTLTLEDARQIDYGEPLDADGYSSITEAAALALAKHPAHGLYLNGLTSLFDAVAKALADHNGKVHFGALAEKDEWLYGKYCTEHCL